MSFIVGSGCFPAVISKDAIYDIASTGRLPEMSLWEKIKEFFCFTHQHAALECIQKICRPPVNTAVSLKDVKDRFELLRRLSFPGFSDYIQRNTEDGTNHFCIRDENAREILSVSIDGGIYTVKCEGCQISQSCNAHLQRLHEVPDYETEWTEWIKNAPEEETANRSKAIQLMRDCLKTQSTTLNLRYLNLTTLPTSLPGHINRLWLNSNKLTYLPEKLPAGLQELGLSSNLLKALPKKLPDGLQILCASNNRLLCLPEALPSHLRYIDVNVNNLESLPEHLPASLGSLHASNNHLPSLPAKLPDGLETLDISYNRLTKLSDLPLSIHNVDTSGNQLTCMPELSNFTCLEKLDLRNNRITMLPDLAKISLASMEIRIRHNPLSAHTIQNLQTLISAADYQGPLIIFRASSGNNHLYQSVADWLAHPSIKWTEYACEENAKAFSDFMKRLKETVNARCNNGGFKTQVASWLKQLSDDNTLRKKSFALAMKATETCEDRVTLTYNQMQALALAHRMEKCDIDQDLSEVITTAREFFRLEKLEQIARNKVNNLKGVIALDEIEVYLGYQNKLKKALELSSVTKEMRYFEASRITKLDVKVAEREVKTAENSQFSEWFELWAPWHDFLKRTARENWDTAIKMRYDFLENKFEEKVNSELRELGLKGDEEENQIGVKITNEMNRKVFHELTTCVLEDRNAAHLLGARWLERKRPARTVLTEAGYSAGSATRQGSSSLTRLSGQ